MVDKSSSRTQGSAQWGVGPQQYVAESIVNSYTGLYEQCLSDGKTHSVKVIDPFGNSVPLDPSAYFEREVDPAIEQLPAAANNAAKQSGLES